MDNEITRFLKAQENKYNTALDEIISGRKKSHWMWFIFPQFIGLGESATSKIYAIKNLKEAKEYLYHPVLGNRLTEITNALLNLENSDAKSIFGSPDDLKLKSCMTLFSAVHGANENIFKQVLNKFFDNVIDEKTILLIRNAEERYNKIRICPNWIDKLDKNEIFVFGSNILGLHNGGAAKLAMSWGAIKGQGAGLQGQTYAIPTMQGGAETIKPYVDEFLTFANLHPELKFLVTEIGCGIAGYTAKQIAPLFKQAIDDNILNVYLPSSFNDLLLSETQNIDRRANG